MSNVIKLRELDSQLKIYLNNVLMDIEKTFDCTVSSFNMVLEVENGHCVIHHRNIDIKE